MEQAKLLSMTVVLTLLIWVTADSLVNEATTLPVQVEPVPRGDADMLVETALPGDSARVELTLSGPRREIEEIAARERLVLRIPVDKRPPGASELSLDKELLRREIENQWRSERVAVISASPGELPIQVDRLVFAEVELVLNRLSMPFDEPPQLQRTTVPVRMRESVYRRLTSGGQQRPTVDLSEEVERQLLLKPVGQRVDFRVTLDRSQFGPQAVIDTPDIGGTAVVQARRSVEEIPTVPIKLVVSFAGLKEPLQPVARDGTPLTLVTQTIKVEGPTEVVARLQRGETRAYGLIQLKEAELLQPAAFRAWTPEFVLPAGVKLAEPPQPVEFMLAPVSAAEPS